MNSELAPAFVRPILVVSACIAALSPEVGNAQTQVTPTRVAAPTKFPISESGNIPVSAKTPFTSYSPVVFTVPDRPVPLEVKVSAPATGTKLPVILLSHGHGNTNYLSSLNGYAPLAEFWAAHGFIVIQPTHIDSKALGLRQSNLPDAPTFYYSKVKDMHFILDRLTEIEATVPGLAGRMDRDRIAAVGHSSGGLTAAYLIGAQVLDPADTREKDLADKRIKAAVIITAPGEADMATSAAAANRYRSLRYNSFANMTGSALVIAGDKDVNPAFSTRLSYRWDAYSKSPPGNKALLTFFGGEHILGGIAGWDSWETTDENPERVATLRALTWAYLRSQLYPGDPAWRNAVAALESSSAPMAKVENR
jgi:acetyl esterase/lipase